MTNYSPNDVITLKGGQAQTTTHPGNLKFYKLCEERFEAFTKSASTDKKLSIIQEIISIISESGGKFYNLQGKKMKEAQIVAKIKDRFRQISKPKLVPNSSVGDYDVVFCSGGQNHLYPGNAKYRALLDTFASKYFAQLFDDSIQEESIDRYAIRDEIIQIVESRGGVFRGPNMRVVSKSTIHEKIHSRMKDIKKLIRSGKFKEPKDEESRLEEVYTLSKTGCTSVKSTITISEKDQLMKKKLYKEMSRTAIGQAKKGTSKSKKRQREQGYESDDSFDSQKFLSDDDDDDEDESDDENESEGENDTSTNSDTKEPKLTREERMKRRREIASLPPEELEKRMKQARPKRVKKIKKKEDIDEENEIEKRELTAYEKLRLEKIKRNQQRLKELGF